MKTFALTVLVLNMHAGYDAARQDNLQRVAALIRETGADIVLLQEVDRGTRRSRETDQVAVLEKLTGLNTLFGRTLDYDGGAYGVALMARAPIRGEVFPLHVDPPQERAGGSREPRGVLVGTSEPSGRALTVGNTHLDAGREDLFRLQEVGDLLAVLDRLRPALPRIVGGDFNAPPDSEVHTRVLRAGYIDAWLACGHGQGFTYPADIPVKRIDYLFLGPGVRCTHAEVLAFDGSDHRPLLVRVTVDPD